MIYIEWIFARTFSHRKAAPFPKVSAYTGSTVLDCRKRKEDIEIHKIDELHEFSNDTSHDLKF